MEPPSTNFKGVMLCNRPNEQQQVAKDKPFCSRVQPQDQLGLGHKFEEPAKKPREYNPVLERHKKWLEEFKIQSQLKKHAQQEEQIREDEKFQRVRELAKKDREVTKKMKEEYQRMNEIIKNELSDTKEPVTTVKLTEANLKKLENKIEQPKGNKRYKTKPVWAMTREEEELQQKKEEDELLAFAENLDYDQFVNDLEVNVMLKALQQRVEEIKKNDNWKADEEKKYDDQKPQQQIEEQPDIYDRISQNLSKGDDAKSVHSEKTLNSIQSLKEKKKEMQQGKGEWDKTTLSDARAPIEERIAKHVADEILRNYKNISSVHSNGSIRKILEREAKKTLQESGLAGPLISTITNEKKTRLDPNNLPYLHRNPAI